MSEYSQGVLQQKNNAEKLALAINTHKARIFGKMGEILKPYMSEEQCQRFQTDASQLFELQLAYLNDVTERMGAVDLDHAKELLETGQARGKRDTVFTNIFQQLSSLKQAILGFHGEAGLALLGMAGDIPRVPAAFERYLENIENIVKQGVVMPEQVLPGPVVWSADSILKVIQPMLGQLRDALHKVGREVQEDNDTMTRKWESMELQNYLYTAVANISEAYARIVGDHDLGDRLRPRPVGRPGRRDKQGEAGEGTDAQNPVTPAEPVTATPAPVNPVG